MRVAASSLTAVACPSLIVAQPSSSPAGAPPLVERRSAAEPTGARRISIDVVVTDKAGAPASGLQLGDFRRLDDTQPQRVLPWARFDESNPATAPPQQLIFRVDAVHASHNRMGCEQHEVDNFLHADGSQRSLREPVSRPGGRCCETGPDRANWYWGLLATLSHKVKLRGFSRQLNRYRKHPLFSEAQG